MSANDITDIEVIVLRWWAELLPTAPASLDDDFFDLGGESLHLVQFLQRVYERYGVELPVTELFADEFSAHRSACMIHAATTVAGDDVDDLAARLAQLPAEQAAALLREPG